jgi:uncharacterized protein (DUF1015 family)
VADVQPFRALSYALDRGEPIDGLTAPPYDVIDPEQRRALLARSPHNVVAIDLPEGAPDPYEQAARTFAQWRHDGVLVRDPEPAVWAHAQDYTGPDGRRRTRHGIFARVRVEEYGPGRIRPHERTHPGPKEDRLRLTRATRANLSPIFALYDDPMGAAWSAVEPATADPPHAALDDPDGTHHRLWRVGAPDRIAAVSETLKGAELLIADGHHRYETARVYAEEVGGEGPHRHVLMCLVALQDPGLTIFPPHRLVRGLEPARQEALAATLREHFTIEPITEDELAPPQTDIAGPLVLGYIDAHFRRAFRLTLKDPHAADALLAPALRDLDTAVLEALILKGPLGLTDDDISHLDGLGYSRTDAEALALIHSGEYDAAFFLRPSPVVQVREIAAAGATMPPKSTFFFPKLLTGLLFNPLDSD